MASGTAGMSSGTPPSRSPTTSRRLISSTRSGSPSHSTASAASVTSASPASGRPRSVASASASRVASITCADEVGTPSARSTPAASTSQRGTTSSARGEQVVVPARRAHAGAVAGPGGEPPVRPRHPGERDLGLAAALEQRGVVLDRRPCGSAPARARRRRPPRSRRASCGPRAARSACTPRAPGRRGPPADVVADRGHRLGDRLEGRHAAVLDHVLPPALRDRRSRPPRPARRSDPTGPPRRVASGSPLSGPGRVGPTASGACRQARRPGRSRYANGRSKNRTGTPCATAQRIACHSGENTANGQNAARRGSSAA